MATEKIKMPGLTMLNAGITTAMLGFVGIMFIGFVNEYFGYSLTYADALLIMVPLGLIIASAPMWLPKLMYKFGYEVEV